MRQRQQVRSFLRLLTIAVLFALAFVASWLNYAGWTMQNAEPWIFFSRFLTRMGPLLALFGIAVVILDGLFERQQMRQLKHHLISQLGSRHADVTEVAATELRAYGWLTDGSLRGANLRRAGWEGGNFRGARLAEARLELANLGGADLRGASLAGAYLSLAALVETDLRGADLRGAECRAANFRGARLEGAVLTQIDLRWADLEGAAVSDEQLELAADLSGAVMPNGVRLRDPEGQPALGIDPDPHGPTFADWLADDLPAAPRVEPAKATAVDAQWAEGDEIAGDEPETEVDHPMAADVELDAIFAGTGVLADVAEAFPQPADDESSDAFAAGRDDDAPSTPGPASEIVGIDGDDMAAAQPAGALPHDGQVNGHVALNDRVHAVAQHAGLSYQAIYARLRRDFGVASYRDIDGDQLVEAHALLDSLARGESAEPDGTPGTTEISNVGAA